MNAQTLTLTKEEADELDMLVRCELSSSAVELHHTVSHDYRASIERHEAIMRSLLNKVEGSRPGCEAGAAPGS